MRNKLLTLGVMLVLCLSLTLIANESFAAEKSVRVTLPKFGVTLNENRVDNLYREYPLIVYKNMTYIPMTWYDSRLLGLETKWSEKDGLTITQGKVTSSYFPYKTLHKNAASFKATVPTFKININGRMIDNSKEKYPLLNYKNVTYFPLTWSFAHDEFGWEYVWDQAKGLTIHSTNPQLKTVSLPNYAGKNDVAMFEGYYYFVETVGNTNKVYRVPENNITNKELVYSYELDTLYGMNIFTFEIRDNELWFVYHLGGASMGSDLYCKVNENGKATLEHRGYLDFKNFSQGTLIIDQWTPPGRYNLIVVPTGQVKENGKRVGDPNFRYGWYVTYHGDVTGYRSDNTTTIIGENIYVLASSVDERSGDLNKIHKININTNETSRITDFGVSSFRIINDKLYYVKDADNYLYSANLDGTNEQKLSDIQLTNNDNGYPNWYAELGGNIYYTTTNKNGQNNIYKVDLVNEDTLLLKEGIESVQIANNKIIIKLLEGEDYGIKVFNKSGQLHLAIVDHISDLFVYNDAMVIVDVEDQLVKMLKY